MVSQKVVIPAQAGIQFLSNTLKNRDSRPLSARGRHAGMTEKRKLEVSSNPSNLSAIVFHLFIDMPLPKDPTGKQHACADGAE
jgi:hypothetical protein